MAASERRKTLRLPLGLGASVVHNHLILASLADWQGLLRSAPVQGRQILRKVLVGRLTLTPRTEGTERYYEYAGEATLGRLLGGMIGSRATAMVTPAGFEPAISTLKGSRPWPG